MAEISFLRQRSEQFVVFAETGRYETCAVRCKCDPDDDPTPLPWSFAAASQGTAVAGTVGESDDGERSIAGPSVFQTSSKFPIVIVDPSGSRITRS